MSKDGLITVQRTCKYDACILDSSVFVLSTKNLPLSLPCRFALQWQQNLVVYDDMMRTWLGRSALSPEETPACDGDWCRMEALPNVYRWYQACCAHLSGGGLPRESPCSVDYTNLLETSLGIGLRCERNLSDFGAYYTSMLELRSGLGEFRICPESRGKYDAYLGSQQVKDCTASAGTRQGLYWEDDRASQCSGAWATTIPTMS